MTTDTDLTLPRLDGTDFGIPSGATSREAPVAKIPSDLEQLYDVPVTVSAVLGHARMQIADLLKIGPGSLLELDRRVGEAIDILVNNRLVARGEVVLIDERLGVTMTEIVRAEP
jgi:flagellar motor switch protein FliN/FliY